MREPRSARAGRIFVTRRHRSNVVIASLALGAWLFAALAGVADACAWRQAGGAADTSAQALVYPSQQGMPTGCDGRCDAEASGVPNGTSPDADGGEPPVAPVLRFRTAATFQSAVPLRGAVRPLQELPVYLRFAVLRR